MINIAVCDDEKSYLKKIKNLIITTLTDSVVYKIDLYISGEDLLEHKGVIDILFLDIEMPGISGIEAGKIIKQQNPNCIFFFITSHNNYLTEIFRLDSFQFLKKPINESDFKFDLNRAISKYKNEHIYIEISNNGIINNILIKDIKYIEIITRQIIIHLTDKTIIHTGKFSDYEEKLISYNFIKTHKSYIVNLNYIETILKDRVIISGVDECIPISRYNKKNFLKKYHEYKIGRCI